jgi:hypothetical protein
MIRPIVATCFSFMVCLGAARAQPVPAGEIYTTQSVVTGFDERNRPLGFRLCFDDVLVKASGDGSVVDDKRFAAYEAKAGDYIDSFSYRDKLFGKPIHDEQGSYDRPHFLTCRFNPQKIDDILNAMGRKPWPTPRPALAMVLSVRGRKVSGVLSSDGAFDPDMRESLATAARRYGVVVNLPTLAALKDNRIDAGAAAAIPADRLPKLAAASDSTLPLYGDLRWSDAAHGWVATWSLDANGRHFKWKVSGVNYDEAFRVAVRGAGCVLGQANRGNCLGRSGSKD